MNHPKRLRGFTLIELLTVMVIILILAGIVLGLVGYAQKKASRSKAEAEIKAMELALESYKTDNGAYPENGDTDALDARMNPPTDPAKTYIKAGALLYQALSGDTGTGGVYTKTYYNVPPSEQVPAPGTQDPTRYIVDPFGNPYGYSTAYQADLNKTPPTNPPTHGYNPTYDLWSTAGYNNITPYPADVVTANTQSNLWTKNW